MRSVLTQLVQSLKTARNVLLIWVDQQAQQAKFSWVLALTVVFFGLLNALSFAPYPCGALWFVSFGFLVLLLFSCKSAWKAAWLTLLFYVPHFMLGLNWLVISMHVYGGLPSLLAWAALSLFALYLASFYALAAALLVRMRLALKENKFQKSVLGSDLFAYFVLFPILWLLADLLRGYVLTGFPWLLAGYAQIKNQMLIAFAPIVGVYGISLLAYWLLGCLLFLGQSKKPTGVDMGAKRSVWACVGIVLMLGFGLSVLSDYWRRENPIRPRHLFTKPADTSLNVALVQGNIEQSMKFDPKYFEQSYLSYLSLMSSPQAAQADLIVLPETVFPIPWQHTPNVFKEALLKKAQNTALIFGAVWQHGTETTNQAAAQISYSNAALTFNRQASEPSAVFHKIHLVPFGEITPDAFEWFAKALNIPYGSFYQGSMNQLPSQINQIEIWLNICYEMLFGEELAQRIRQNNNKAPMLLLNLSNYGWFGDGLVMSQVGNIMLMRANEFEIPLLAATNTGPTNFFDKNEINLSKNNQKKSNVMVKEVFPYTGKTWYLLLGNYVLLLITMLINVAFVCISIKNCIKNTK